MTPHSFLSPTFFAFPSDHAFDTPLTESFHIFYQFRLHPFGSLRQCNLGPSILRCDRSQTSGHRTIEIVLCKTDVRFLNKLLRRLPFRLLSRWLCPKAVILLLFWSVIAPKYGRSACNSIRSKEDTNSLLSNFPPNP
jgi:hypothetical protein